jgi:hypothetical protein
MERALAIPDLMLIQPVRFHLVDLRPHQQNIERFERSACTPLFAGNRDAIASSPGASGSKNARSLMRSAKNTGPTRSGQND